jgi:non-heme chloroperoxidase
VDLAVCPERVMTPSAAKLTIVPKSVALRNRVTLEYVDYGDRAGLPVVFLHGVTDSWLSFGGVLPHLPASMRCLPISQRGHGRSSRPEHGYRFVDFSEDVAQFLDALDIPSAILVGHSMGSYVAQRFAIDHPDRVRGLVLVGTFPRLRGNAGVRELWDTAISTMSDPVDPVLALEFQLSTLARPIPPASLDAFVEESLKVPARVWRATFAEFLEADFSSELPRIGAPTLILWGDRDAFFLRDDQIAVRDAIPGARLVTWPGAGHALHWEDPAQFASDLVAFADEILAGTP